MNGPLNNGELVAMLRDRCQHGQASWAREHGLSEALVSLVLAGKQRPGPKIAAALGYQRKVGWYPLQDKKPLLGK